MRLPGGIDPSLNGTGLYWAGLQMGETIKLTAKIGDMRLDLINSKVADYLGNYEFVVIEDLPINAMGAGITGMVQGVVRLALLRAGVEYLGIPAATLKKAATNSGRADKAMMIAGYAEAYPEAMIADDNQADAAWLAECGKALLGLDHKLKCPAALDRYIPKLPPRVAAERERNLA